MKSGGLGGWKRKKSTYEKAGGQREVAVPHPPSPACHCKLFSPDFSFQDRKSIPDKRSPQLSKPVTLA